MHWFYNAPLIAAASISGLYGTAALVVIITGNCREDYIVEAWWTAIGCMVLTGGLSYIVINFLMP